MPEIEAPTTSSGRKVSILNSLKMPTMPSFRGNISNSADNVKDNTEVEDPESVEVVAIDECPDNAPEIRRSMNFGNISLPSFRSSKSPTSPTAASSLETTSERNFMMLANPISLLNLAHDALKKSTSTKKMDGELSFENFENYYACEAYGARTPKSSAKC